MLVAGFHLLLVVSMAIKQKAFGCNAKNHAFISKKFSESVILEETIETDFLAMKRILN